MLKTYTTLLFLFFLSLAGAEENLTEEEKKLINAYVEKVDIHDALGQLFMVGLPADFRTINDKGREGADRLIGDFGLGMSIVYDYTYYDDNKKGYEDSDYLLDIVSYNKKVKKRSEKSKLKLPVLIATDFEGVISPSINPTIKRGVIVPPPSLTLSASQYSDGVHDLGVIVGSELVSLGVDILLGPVLDTHNVELSSKENNFKKDYMKSRNFSSTIEGVEKTAKPYLEGLKTSGILTFAKHFPSYGAVESNPHEFKEAIYDTSSYTLKNDVKPFIKLNKKIDGIMSSHVTIKDNGEKIFSTFSKKIIQQVKTSDFEEKIVITDDLSNMGAIKKYMTENNKSYADVAILAFDAGHDVFLFSHTKINDKNKKDLSKISVDDLFKIKEALYSHIFSSKENTQKFKNSLRKVVYLKFKYLKSKDKNLTVQNFLNGFVDDSINEKEVSNFVPNIEQKIKKSIIFCRDRSCSPGFSYNIINTLVDKATIVINDEGVDFSVFKDNMRDKKIVFAIHENYVGIFKSSLDYNFNNEDYVSLPIDKSKIKNQEITLSEYLKSADFLFYSVFSSTDNDIVERLIKIKEKNNYKAKIIVFLHESPSVLTMRVLTSATVVGSFSTHSASFDANLRLINGTLKPSAIENMPISLGKFHDVANTKWDNYESKNVQEPKVKYENCIQKDINLITTDNEKDAIIADIKSDLNKVQENINICKLELDSYKKNISLTNYFKDNWLWFTILFLALWFIFYGAIHRLSGSTYAQGLNMHNVSKLIAAAYSLAISLIITIFCIWAASSWGVKL